MANEKEIILTNIDKCQGCNKCIAKCPVGANDARIVNGENKIETHPERCIQCADCLRICDHGARDYADDVEDFFNDLQNGVPISVIAAPAIRYNFPQYKKLFAWLKQRGVQMIYDVSFGADITTWAYLKAIRDEGLDSVISQPCPVVVSYIEHYKPSLISRLAPVHSPAMCTAVYLHKYAGCDTKIAFLSPCIAKRSEFIRPENDDHISYNVTYNRLKEYMQKNNISLNGLRDQNFDNQPCGLGLVYSRPGGLRECVEYATHGKAWVRQVEGSFEFKEYLDEYEMRIARNKPLPLLVDLLNCKHGCNFGTAACNTGDLDDTDARMNELKGRAVQENPDPDAYALFEEFDAKLNLQDFKCEYSDKSFSCSAEANGKQRLEEVYISMGKLTEESRRINCYSCGYGSCEKFATACANGQNHIENCTNYARGRVRASLDEFNVLFGQLRESVAGVDKNLEEFNETANGLEKIARTTKIISVNANIEAAHAGSFGSSFAVVASEIKHLSDNSSALIEQSRKSEKAIADEIAGFSDQMDAMRKKLNEALH